MNKQQNSHIQIPYRTFEALCLSPKTDQTIPNILNHSSLFHNQTTYNHSNTRNSSQRR